MTAWRPDADYPVQVDQLPFGWSVVPLGHVILDIKNGFSSSSFNDDNSGLPHLRPMNISRAGEIVFEQVKYVNSDSSLRLNRGDVVFNNTNSRAHVGKTGIFESDEDWGFSNHITRLRAPADLLPQFLAAQLLMLFRAGYFHRRARQHVNQASISSKTLSQTVPLIVAPVEHQYDLVERLDADMARLRSIENSATRVRHSLREFKTDTFHEVYKRSLADHGANYDEMQQQLSLDQAVRRPIWQIGQVQLGKKRVPSTKSAIRMHSYLRVANVLEDLLDLEDVAEMHFSDDEWPKYKLEPGDVLLNEGQSPELVGRAAMFRGELEDCGFQNSLIRFRPNQGVSASYALLIFRHYLHSGEFRRAARWTTNLAHLTVKRFSDLTMPVPSLERQELLASAAQQRIDAADVLDNALRRIVERVDLARTAVLTESFAAVRSPATEVEEIERPPSSRRSSHNYQTTSAPTRRKLVDIVNDNDVGLESDQLFEASGIHFDMIEEFYEELRSLIDVGLVREEREGSRSIIRPGNGDGR